MQRIASFAAALFLTLLAGCTRSMLYVDSEPQGAEVFFNGQPKGTTPTEFEFTWYGGHRLKLRKEGYSEMDEVVVLKPPAHYWPPIDLVTELIPATVADRQERSFELVPSMPTETPVP